jgi:uncharacterized protein
MGELMKNYLFLITIICLSLLSINVYGFEPPKPNGYIVDLAGKLTSEQLIQLNNKLDNLNKTTKNEYAGLIIPSLNGETIEDVSNSTFKSWGVGKKGLDNGVLIVIAVDDRKFRVEVGKGVEGELTDLQSNDILKYTLGPYLKKGEFFEGLNSTYDEVNKTIENRSSVAELKSVNTKNKSGNFKTYLYGGLLSVFILSLIAGLVKKIRDSDEEESGFYPYKDYPDWYKSTNKRVREIKKRKTNKTNKINKSNHSYDYGSSSSNSSSNSSSSDSGFGGGDSCGGGSSGDW